MSGKKSAPYHSGMFSIKTWLWDDLEFQNTSPKTVAFQTRFAALLAAPTPHETKQHWLALRNMVLTGDMKPDHANMARFCFQAGCALRGKRLFHDAYDAFAWCLRFIPTEDAAATVQVMTKFAAVKMNLTYYKDVSRDFMAILQILEERPEIAFTKGSAQGMHCHACIQLANCYLSLWHVETAYRYVARAAHTLNTQFTDEGTAVPPLAITMADRSPRMITFLSPPDAFLEKQVSEAAMWLELYTNALWVYGLLLMWECRISTEEYTSKPSNELKQYLHLLEEHVSDSAIELSGKREYRRLLAGVQQNYRDVSTFGRFGVEVIFTLCTLDMVPLETGLTIAHELIDLIKGTNTNTPEKDRFPHFDLSTPLLEFQCRWWEISLDAQKAGIRLGQTLPAAYSTQMRELIAEIETFLDSYQQDYKKNNPRVRLENDLLLQQIIGNYEILLAHLNREISEDERADFLVQQAIKRFLHGDDGFMPRLIEAELLLHEDEE